MKAMKLTSVGKAMVFLLLLSIESSAQKFSFASDNFLSYVTSGTSTFGLIYCADSASNISVYDESGVLLATYYLPGQGCVELVYDSSIIFNAASPLQLDKNRLIIEAEVDGNLYQATTQNIVPVIFGGPTYPYLYDMRLVPPPGMAGTANIQMGYNHTWGINNFPYSLQIFGITLEMMGIADTSKIVIHPGWPHPYMNGQQIYQFSLPPDDIWMEAFLNGTGLPMYPIYYPPTIIEQDSLTSNKGRFIVNTGFWNIQQGNYNPWINYNFRFLFFPLAYEFLGTSYHTIPHATRLGDSLMAFSFHDGTILNVNGNIDTLAKGEIYRALIDTPSTWSANYPFSLVQISRQSAQDSVFQSAMFAYSVHPDEALLTYTWYPSEIIDDTIPNQQSYLNLLSPTNGVSTVKLDGNALAGFFHPYPNDPGWSWAQVPVASSVHKLEADSGVIAYAYQYGESCGAGFNVGGLRMKNSGTTSQPEMNERNEINLHPNPAKNVIHITNLKSNQKELKASVWDMDGRMVMEEQLLRANFSLDIGSLKPGMYILKIQLTSEREAHVLRFVKIP